ncbi:family S53 protease [Trametes versicolor FP-101664 SS1]|uniref:family S53 protease n=1 Tax=Trametes versicolor (strain FP-101664) TaxID=717944 RepID=UPI0004624040|nr:family S53 protease [Trametes versicolor FP-101664 SS1]EIW62968.1 family S53 protease [Trametes versicolor FP-101664 SS1]
MFSSTLLVVCLAAVAYGKPMARSMQVHETRESVPSAFQRVSAAPSDATLNLRIALVQNDMAGLEKALMDVSDPASPLKGQFLTKEEVNAFVAPKPETVAAVNAWLTENDIVATAASPAGDMLSFSIPVSKASELLDADFAVFNHTATGKTMIRTLAYSIPAELKGHLDFVHPTTVFVPAPADRPVPEVNVTSDAVPASCATTITPACLQALYGIPTAAATQRANTLGVSGFIDQFANQADLRAFLTRFRPDMSSATAFTLQTLDGGQNPQQLANAGIEADLDTQYTIGIATGVPTTFISVGDNNRDGVNGFMDIINTLLGESAPPQVLSTSYGFDEPDLPASVATNLCNAYMQLGARGTSILFSSGDGGVSGSQSQSCTTFIPTFPSGCPFVTSVGATTRINPEVAATFTGGGFSNTFAAPSYQSAAVSTFLTANGNTNSGRFNRAGRGFPDISAQGQNVDIVFQNQVGTVAGTSCSCPITASIISLLNDELRAAGKPSLGFLNPFLYSTAGRAALTDITSGSNPGCNTNGFTARAGWDPVTGLGTPNFAALRTAVGL